ncbi:MAG: rhomboid family intramembrane serine protease [Acidobacteria bacterium]|nr:rhomboid family intramembrane serine protease [Acidobacteriota bacterium]MBS1865391.1 rhomboid family intramembrane serine protease [Acidobacteriota bacterium]
MALPYRWQIRLDRLKRSFAGVFGSGGGEQQPRPKLCPACGSLVGISATKCHECGTNLTFSLAALTRKLSGITGLDAPVSTIFLGLNFFLFIIQLMFTMQAGQAGGLNILWRLDAISSYKLGAIYGPSVLIDHQFWRLITAMFLHGGLIHIGFNMMTLMQVGPTLEEVYGSPRFLFLYTFTGAIGFLFSSLRGHFSLGASGALLGVIGAILAITTKRGGAYMRQLRSRLISSLAFLFILGIWGGIGIDNWAHAGGLAAGFALGKIMADREPMNNTEKRRAQILGWLSALAIIASFVLMLLHFHDPIN